ncbi:TetR/AcrR family transcriptional regulator [Sphingomonas sp. PL-96]|uniref:TetR/AcrR family transcriptional regulator n=1 Tax=Sphingomonas sp. PL-96 TaxID=2887201 RepID=UPI001E4E0C50|nr:TetR/AcrR family transcriptional regulator [Sphingomonas sp. PL-96]MCC2978252.1 TetR/AcrR family transcriptional regulator [Sphingomonas sp. PL-96]
MKKGDGATRDRRTQAERTATTRRALIGAAITVLHRSGYGAATSANIADEAGVSRGSIIHHFGSRANLLREVVDSVFKAERDVLLDIHTSTGRGSKVEDWPDLFWELYSSPAGLAVLEIVIAARSDQELWSLVGSAAAEAEEQSISRSQELFGGPREHTIDAVRLLAWSIRGLSTSTVLVDDPGKVKRSLDLFRAIIQNAAENGVLQVEKK